MGKTTVLMCGTSQISLRATNVPVITTINQGLRTLPAGSVSREAVKGQAGKQAGIQAGRR